MSAEQNEHTKKGQAQQSLVQTKPCKEVVTATAQPGDNAALHVLSAQQEFMDKRQHIVTACCVIC
jgi:hypothetical protein